MKGLNSVTVGWDEPSESCPAAGLGVAAERAALYLLSITPLPDPLSALSTAATTFTDLAPGEKDPSGWAGQQTLKLDVAAEVVPEPGMLATLTAGILGALGRRWHRLTQLAATKSYHFMFCYNSWPAAGARNASPSVFYQRDVGRVLRSSSYSCGRRLASSRDREPRPG